MYGIVLLPIHTLPLVPHAYHLLGRLVVSSYTIGLAGVVVELIRREKLDVVSFLFDQLVHP